MSASGQLPQSQWLARTDPQNPFGFDVVDCRSIALNMMSTTSDPQVAASFLGLRHSKVGELAGKRPTEPIVVSCDFSIACVAALSNGPIFVSPTMEHKWDVYAHDGKVYARRSWTGNVVHVADVKWLTTGRLSVRSLVCDAGTVFGIPQYARAQLHFLLSTYLERRLRPFPIPPPHVQDDANTIAWGGWSAYGRAARFACSLDAYRLDD